MKQANTKILPFVERVELVGVEVSTRLAKCKPKQREALRARLWCVWLRREVIS